MTVTEVGTADRTVERVDGRTLRRDRNREAVIDALLTIIREGNVDPGGADIAERAGVSHRSIFRYFDDLGDLVRTAIDKALDEALPLGTIEHPGRGTLAERIDVLVRTRLAMFDVIHPVATVARARALTIPEINVELVDVVSMFRSLMHEHFAPELAKFPFDSRASIVDAAQVLVSWDGYDVHRRLFGHDDARIARSWTTSLTALLTVAD